MEKKLLLATGNANKVREIKEIFAAYRRFNYSLFSIIFYLLSE